MVPTIQIVSQTAPLVVAACLQQFIDEDIRFGFIHAFIKGIVKCVFIYISYNIE